MLSEVHIPEEPLKTPHPDLVPILEPSVYPPYSPFKLTYLQLALKCSGMERGPGPHDVCCYAQLRVLQYFVNNKRVSQVGFLPLQLLNGLNKCAGNLAYL